MEDKLLFIQTVLQPADLCLTKPRFIILPLLTAVIIGNLFVYDNPVAPQTPLMDETFSQRLNIDLFKFNLFYSIYPFPNIILPLIGGFLVDKFGARICLVVYSSIACAGQAISALGMLEGSYWIALLGRGVYGIGAQSQNGDVYIVTQGGILSK